MTGHELAFDLTDAGTVARCICGFEGELRVDPETALADGARHAASHLLARIGRLNAEVALAADELWEVLGAGELASQLRVGAGLGDLVQQGRRP